MRSGASRGEASRGPVGRRRRAAHGSSRPGRDRHGSLVRAVPPLLVALSNGLGLDLVTTGHVVKGRVDSGPTVGGTMWDAGRRGRRTVVRWGTGGGACAAT